MTYKLYRVYILIFAFCFIVTIFSHVPIVAAQPVHEQKSAVQIANPASKYCIEQGGDLVIRKHKDGGEYGVCLFKDGRQCEEWAMFRGECPAGGIDITGYSEPEALYCVITGGLYKGGTEYKQGTCTFRNGKICNVLDYYAGNCNRYANEIRTYTDPFKYCAEVGTVDIPDERYNGAKVPDSIIQNMIYRGILSADAPPEFQHNVVWRCMDHHVWVCQFGANIPCMEKADISKFPGKEMTDYCKTNPAGNVPAYAAGRTTVYEWKCINGTPEIVKKILKTDRRGYPAVYWQKLTPK